MKDIDIPTLSTAELETLKACLFKFVVRILSEDTNTVPEEVTVLPAMTEILLRFTE
ncbi:MAG: hypothetical protein II832_07715 [Synergistaceae bacterium]|nr:hypothetical protein [Synergistaceae bacterium]